MTQYMNAYMIKPIIVTLNSSMWHGGVTERQDLCDKETGVRLPNVLRYVTIPGKLFTVTHVPLS